jgi:hypothetical protein
MVAAAATIIGCAAEVRESLILGVVVINAIVGFVQEG